MEDKEDKQDMKGLDIDVHCREKGKRLTSQFDLKVLN